MTADSFEDILARCLLRVEEEGIEALEAFCVKHPEHADHLRRSVQNLRGMQLLGKGETEDPSEADVPRHDDRPNQIGPFKILDVLGEGGMGTVYIAEQKEPVRRRVALKVIKLGMDSKEVLARFEVERQALAMMEHDHIAKVFDAGTTDRGQPYFAMEHVPGLPITEYCDKQRLTTRQRLELFQQVCAGVQHAHQKGIIHRDLKPSNILVTETQGRAVPKIIDFGVAKATNQRLTEATVFTAQGQIIGTPEYMSPEQAEMTSADIDTRTDVYSLGVILYELLVGELPFPAAELRKAGLVEIQRKIREDEPPKPSTRLTSRGVESTQTAQRRKTTVVSLARELREDLDWIVLRALEKDRNRRYPTPVGLAEDIERHLEHQPVNAGPPSAAYRMKKFVRRYRGQVVAATLVFLALVAGAIGTTAFAWEADREAEQRRAIEYERLLARGEEANPASFAIVVKSEREEQPETGEMSRSIFSQAIALDPDRPEAYWLRALTPGDIEENLRDITSAEAYGLSSGTAHWLKACLLIAQNRFGEAEEERKLAESFPAALTPANLYAQAQFLDLTGEKEAALALLTDAIERSDPVAIIRYLSLRHRATMFEEMHRPEEALSNLFAIQGLGDDSVSVRIRIAIQWRRLGQGETADEIFAKALQEVRGSNDPAQWYALSRACHESLDQVRPDGATNNPDDTEWHDQVSREAVQAHPESVELLVDRADSLRHQGDRDGALDMSLRALALDPSYAWAYSHHGTALQEKGQLDEAIAAFREAIRLKPDKFNYHYNLGNALATNGQLDDALAAFREAIKLNPGYALAYNNLGVALRRKGQLDDAIAAHRNAIRLEPDLAQAYDSLGVTLATNGQLDDAIAAFREAVKLMPDDAKFNSNLGFAFVLQRKFNDAIQAFQLAMKLDPQYVNAPYNMASAYALMGDKDQAFEWLEKAVNVGFKDTAQMASDSDLDSLRDDPRYNEIIALMEVKKQK